MRGIGMSPRDFEASINGSKTSLMKLPPPQSGHSNRAFDLLAGGPSSSIDCWAISRNSRNFRRSAHGSISAAETSLKIGRASHDTERRFGGRIGGRRPSMSLRKVIYLVGVAGFEPATPSSRTRCIPGRRGEVRRLRIFILPNDSVFRNREDGKFAQYR